MAETRLAILVYLEHHQYVRWEHIVKELEGYKNFPGVDKEMRKLLGERKIEKMFAPDEPPFCSVKLSRTGYSELREMGYKGNCSIQQMFEQNMDAVKIPKDSTGDNGGKKGKKCLENRQTNLEFLIRCTFGFLCGCFLFSHPVIIFLLLLFIAYTCIVKM